jgi:hypothetical protein
MKQKMPDGWVHVEWKDSTGKKWFNNMPESDLMRFKFKVMEKDGKIIKVVR